jgi:hypothetical protein
MLQSRRGTDLTARFPEVLAGARELGSVVLDGELVAYAERPGWSSGRRTTDQPLPQTVRARRVDQGPLLRGHRRRLGVLRPAERPTALVLGRAAEDGTV